MDMSSKENIMSVWPKLDKKYRDFWKTSEHYDMADVVVIDPNKPNAWFFGDSFVQWPKDNVWKPITDKCNLVHHGRGGTGLEALYMQLLSCRRWIQPEDRVVICYSHYTRDIGKDGSRWQFQGGEPRFYADADTINPLNQKEITDLYVRYHKEIAWELSTFMRYHAYKDIINRLKFKTNYVARFEAFDALNNRERKWLHDHWIEDDEIEQTITFQKQMPFWTFVHKMAGFEELNTEVLKHPFIQTRLNSRNHFEDEDVPKFWKYYIETLNKLDLESI